MRTALLVELNAEQIAAREHLARARSQPARVVERAGVVLLAAGGLQDKQIARRHGEYAREDGHGQEELCRAKEVQQDQE